MRKLSARDGRFVLEDAPSPRVPEDGILVRIERALLGARESSAAGVVVACGRAPDLPLPGERVACVLGEVAELVAVERGRFARVPAKLSSDDAALVGPASRALHALHETRAGLGESLVVAGLELEGLLAVVLGVASGARVDARDAREERVALARELGAQRVAGVADAGLVFEDENRSSIDVRGRLVTASARPDVVLVAGETRVNASGDVKLVAPETGKLELSTRARERVVASGRGAELEPGLELPIAHVRWTAERTMTAALELLVGRRLPPVPRRALENAELGALVLFSEEVVSPKPVEIPEEIVPDLGAAIVALDAGKRPVALSLARRLAPGVRRHGRLEGAPLLVLAVSAPELDASAWLAQEAAPWLDALVALAGGIVELRAARGAHGLALLARHAGGGVSSVLAARGAPRERLEVFSRGRATVLEGTDLAPGDVRAELGRATFATPDELRLLGRALGSLVERSSPG